MHYCGSVRIIFRITISNYGIIMRVSRHGFPPSVPGHATTLSHLAFANEINKQMLFRTQRQSRITSRESPPLFGNKTIVVSLHNSVRAQTTREKPTMHSHNIRWNSTNPFKQSNTESSRRRNQGYVFMLSAPCQRHLCASLRCTHACFARASHSHELKEQFVRN